MAEKGITITEGLASIKTLSKRVQKKREAIAQVLARQEAFRDPMEKDGGSVEYIKRERQAMGDLEVQLVDLRRRIAEANAKTNVNVGGTTRSIADWLTWRREVAPGHQQFLSHLRRVIDNARREAQQKGLNVVSATAVVGGGEVKPTDIVVNVSEVELAKEIEALEETLGTLDGVLSLKNATTKI